MQTVVYSLVLGAVLWLVASVLAWISGLPPVTTLDGNLSTSAQTIVQILNIFNFIVPMDTVMQIVSVLFVFWGSIWTYRLVRLGLEVIRSAKA